MDQAVDALFDFHKRAEIDQVAHQARQPCTYGIFLVQRKPGVVGCLLQAKRNLLTLFVHVQNHNLQLVANGNKLGRMTDMLCPGHLRNVDQALHALLQFHKRSVVRDTHDFAIHPVANRVFVLDIFPWMRCKLLHSQGDPLALLVVVEHLYLDVVTNGQHFRRMSDPAPGNIRNVQQTVQTTQVDKPTEVRDVLHRAFAYLADFQRFKNLFAQALPLGLQHDPPGNDDITPVLVEFDDAKGKDLANELIEILHLFDIDL